MKERIPATPLPKQCKHCHEGLDVFQNKSGIRYHLHRNMRMSCNIRAEWEIILLRMKTRVETFEEGDIIGAMRAGGNLYMALRPWPALEPVLIKTHQAEEYIKDDMQEEEKLSVQIKDDMPQRFGDQLSAVSIYQIVVGALMAFWLFIYWLWVQLGGL